MPAQMDCQPLCSLKTMPVEHRIDREVGIPGQPDIAQRFSHGPSAGGDGQDQIEAISMAQEPVVVSGDPLIRL